MPEYILRADPIAGIEAIFERKTPDVLSTSTVTATTGSKTFTVAAGLAIEVGDWLAIEPVVTPIHFLVAEVTAYVGTSLTVTVHRAVDAGGTYSNWRMVDVTPLYAPNLTRSMQRLIWSLAHSMVSTSPALTQSMSFTIPAQALGATYNDVFPLFAHGLSSPHEVDGKILNFFGSGSHLPICGSTPVWMQQQSGLNNGFGCFVEIGCTDTHVVAIVFASLSHSASATTMPATTLTIEASVYDYNTTGVLPAGNPALPLRKIVPGQYAQFGRGRLDTRRRYPRRVDSGGDAIIAKSQTMTIIGAGNTGARPAGQTVGSYAQNEIGWRWRYECAGYVKQTERAWNGTTTNGGTATADIVRVKK